MSMSPLILGVAVAVALFVVSFLLGSIPWGVIISRVFYHTDVRDHGSGNIGTTNALRTMGKVGGGAVFLLDFGKGLVSGLLAVLALVPLASVGSQPVTYEDLVGIAFIGCVLGHVFSPWLGWHGGKGVAVAVGCLFLTFGPVGALIEIALFAVLVVTTRYVSVGSVAAAVVCPILAAYYFLVATMSPVTFVCCTVAAVVVIWAHRENLARLRSGIERRVGDKKKHEN